MPRKNRFAPQRLQAIGLALLLSLPLLGWAPRRLAAEDAKAAKIRALMQTYSKRIVPVEFTIEIWVGMRSRRMLGNTVGIVASADGTVLVSDAIFKTSAAAKSLGGTISKPTSFEVVLPDRSRRPARYLGTDEDVGLAFLKIDNMADAGLEPVTFALNRKLAVAEEVVAIGLLPRSHDYATTFALARVNSVQTRPILMYGTSGDLLPMLGCPVVTLDGQAVGVVARNSFQADPRRGLNMLDLSVSRGSAWILPGQVFARLVRTPPKQKAKKGWLGIEMQAMTPDIGEALGAPTSEGIIVSRVFRGKGFAAEKAGLKEEDIITQFDGRKVPVSRDDQLGIFRQMVRDAGPKSRISLRVLRNNKPLELTLNLSETPKTRDEARKVVNRSFGIVVSEITFDAALYMDIGLDTMGVLVDYVERGSWASLGGMRRNDVIQKIDNAKINTIDDFTNAVQRIEKVKPTAVISILVLRGNETVFLRIEPDWR